MGAISSRCETTRAAANISSQCDRARATAIAAAATAATVVAGEVTDIVTRAYTQQL